MEKMLAAVLSHFLDRWGHEQTRRRDPKTGRFLKSQNYFACVALNYVPITGIWHNFSYTLIAPKIDMDAMSEKLVQFIEKEIRYDRSEWWFAWKDRLNVQYPTETDESEGDFYDHVEQEET